VQRLTVLKGKFHYAIWFEAGRRPASNQLRTSSEPASVMEFVFNLLQDGAWQFFHKSLSTLII